jgi:hypothetical protein
VTSVGDNCGCVRLWCAFGQYGHHQLLRRKVALERHSLSHIFAGRFGRCGLHYSGAWLPGDGHTALGIANAVVVVFAAGNGQSRDRSQVARAARSKPDVNEQLTADPTFILGYQLNRECVTTGREHSWDIGAGAQRYTEPRLLHTKRLRPF